LKKLITSIFILINLGCNSIDCNKLSFIEFTETEKIIGLNGNPYSGKCKFLYKNGQVNSSRQYLKGKYHGIWTFYYKNGNIETEGQYNKGKKTGDWKYYYESGKIKQLSYYKDGKGVGLWQKFDKNGDLYWGKRFN